MASRVVVCGLLLVAACGAARGASLAESQGVNEKCRHNLTKFDPYLSQYIGKRYEIQGAHTDKTYKYNIGICVDVDHDGIPGCAVKQTDSTSNSSHSFCIGRTAEAQVARMADGTWIELTYSGGDVYHSHCDSGSRTARIVFLCDPNVKGQGHVDFLEENNKDAICYYLFSLVSEEICGIEPGQLSAGDIILIILACLVGVWALAMFSGCLYKRFVVGAKGWEQIPCISFYREFGNLMADGCDYVCRSRPRTVVEYKEPTFGAASDSEDEKDDNLLPM
jgi:cation-dependent mannose-6-phosphate receptor